jgi:predicted heme/steroid binding protein
MALILENKMKMRIVVPALIGICAGLMAGTALAETNHFLGRWHWNKALSTLAPGEPAPQDVKSSIVSADGGQIKWTADLTDEAGKRHIETFDGKPDGTFFPVVGAGADVTASFSWNNGTLQSVFRSAHGGSDTQTCTVSADDKQMTCRGTWSDGRGKSEQYVDVYDRT